MVIVSADRRQTVMVGGTLPAFTRRESDPVSDVYNSLPPILYMIKRDYHVEDRGQGQSVPSRRNGLR